MSNTRSSLALCAGLILASSLAGASTASATPVQTANSLVRQSVAVIHTMERDPKLKDALEQSKGIFIVPRFGQGGLIVGGRGGEGVVLAHENGNWSDPAFYNIGGVSIGAQAGAAGGSIAYLLMTPNAFNDIKGSNNFSLNADAGLSIVEWSGKAQSGWGKADVILWSGASGAYAGATIGVTDIGQNQNLDKAYYKNANADVNAIFDGKVRNLQANQLVAALR